MVGIATEGGEGDTMGWRESKEGASENEKERMNKKKGDMERR